MLGCFSRLRRPPPATAPAPVQAADDASTSAESTSTVATTSSSSSAPFKKNIISLHAGSNDDGAIVVSAKKKVDATPTSSALSESPGLSSAIASRRFFLSSPGRSNSIVDSSSSAMHAVGGVAAVPTYSPDPHGDFLRSMEEMAAALRLRDARRRGDRARLHELLLCYLALNDRGAHRYVVSAFTDLLLRLTRTADLDDDDEEGL
ncbi:transcription repressor OFP12 [Brachypodium distachyon]|uniref:Transcription repressor n=1 Tax=Brachypodium distachyon TaxID=15368 RepID=I1H9I5_BRADI|nr:transcription repressor OFP12 [Brachypodium distachyon]KQK23546.1 hypothetical protein BRADI_1g74520v3 [Brachypodium distachyon]PNT78156.1 hypothetical protein BRADI_1g74520v3 [Brachypodium distachyon]|eukprot:XP_003562053.1 transcription repressor OFP12 [Brachypodium distachyon]